MNHFMGIGRVGMVDSRKIKNDVVVTSVSVALNERYPDKDGKPVEKTTWVRVTCWRKLGEIAQQILHTGDLVAFTGKLEQPSVYKNQKGEYVASLELTGETIEKLSKKGEHERPTARPPRRPPPTSRPARWRRRPPASRWAAHPSSPSDHSRRLPTPRQSETPPGCGRNGTMTKYISVLTLRHVVLLIILIVVLLNSR